jgi:hypothetical protein
VHPQLYTNAGVRIAELNNIIQDSATIKRVINGEFTFAFEAIEQELKSEYFDVDNYLVIENQTFDIKCVEQKHETDVVYKIQCEHVNYRLQDGEANSYESFNWVGTPTEILTEILTGTGFSIGTVSFSEEVYLSVNNQTNKKALIYELAKLVEGEVDYTASGFTINLLNTLGQDRGFQARFGRNLQGVTKIIDSRVLDADGNIKVSYSVNILLLKNSNEYIAKGLQGLEVLDLGDAVRIIDEVIGLDVTNRVVSIEYNPIYQINVQLEIANKLAIIVDTISRIDTTTIKQGDVYNGVRMGPAEGFVAERSDGKAKTVVNATDGISIYSDVGSGLVRNFYVDTDGRIKAKSLSLQSGSDVDFSYVSGATKPANNATVGATWGTNLMNIPNTLQAPSGSGLYLSGTNLGFYDSSAWKTYMDNTGNFYLGGVTGKLQWIAGSNTLTIDGGAVVNGTITAATIKTAATGKRLEMSLSSHSGYLSFMDDVAEAGAVSLDYLNNFKLNNLRGGLEIAGGYNLEGGGSGVDIQSYYNQQYQVGGDIAIHACSGHHTKLYNSIKMGVSGSPATVDFTYATVTGLNVKFA